FAYKEPGVENASVEFDVETLSPTYRLSIGLPGRSNALAIARRLGLDEEVTERAASFLTGEERRVGTMLDEIQQERAATAELYARANEAHRRAEETRERLQRELERILGEREGIITAAQAEADESVRRLRDQLDRIEAELRTSTMVPQVALAALAERLDQVVKAEPTLLPPPPQAEVKDNSARSPRRERATPPHAARRTPHATTKAAPPRAVWWSARRRHRPASRWTCAAGARTRFRLSWSVTCTTPTWRTCRSCASSTARGPARCARSCATSWPPIPSSRPSTPPRRTRVATG